MSELVLRFLKLLECYINLFIMQNVNARLVNPNSYLTTCNIRVVPNAVQDLDKRVDILVAINRVG